MLNFTDTLLKESLDALGSSLETFDRGMKHGVEAAHLEERLRCLQLIMGMLESPLHPVGTKAALMQLFDQVKSAK